MKSEVTTLIHPGKEESGEVHQWKPDLGNHWRSSRGGHGLKGFPHRLLISWKGKQ